MTEGISESLCFYIFGIACLTPWNFFITPQSYWNTKFADNPADNSTAENSMQKFWDSSLSGMHLFDILIAIEVYFILY